MCVRIKQINDESVIVNGKIIRKDMDGVWSCQSSVELTPSEEKEFNNYLKAIKHAEEE